MAKKISPPVVIHFILNPADVPEQEGRMDFVFVFTSEKTIGNPSWQNYADSLPESDSLILVPVALYENELGHKGARFAKNCIRAYEVLRALRSCIQ
jgi:hypothetical protein